MTIMDAIAEFARAQLQNEFATGGLVAVAFGAALAAARNLPSQLWRLVLRRIVTVVDVSDHDPAYFWLQSWLADHAYTRDRARLLTASTISATRGNRARPYRVGEEDEPDDIKFSPAPGRHLIRHGGSFVLLDRQRRELQGLGGERGAGHVETISLSALSRDVIRNIILAAREAAAPKESGKISVWRGTYNEWRMVQQRAPRKLESVVLQDGVGEQLAEDVRVFLRSAEWYADHGVPYQRGYLLHGPPGNGKTSLVAAIASVHQRDVYIVGLTSCTDESFGYLMTGVPEHGIVLIEDIDGAFEHRDGTNGKLLTFSGFINAIDGVSAAQGRILFITTNHPEKIDAALRRPGRLDRSFYIGNATPDQARRLFERFFPGESARANGFAYEVAKLGREVSMAELQEHLIMNRDDADAASALAPATERQAAE